MKVAAENWRRQASALTLVFGFVAATSAVFAKERACTIDALPGIPDLAISSATPRSSPTPHCQVIGRIGKEIGFELLLPNDWNGKSIMGGSGGFAGGFTNAPEKAISSPNLIPENSLEMVQAAAEIAEERLEEAEKSDTDSKQA